MSTQYTHLYTVHEHTVYSIRRMFRRVAGAPVTVQAADLDIGPAAHCNLYCTALMYSVLYCTVQYKCTADCTLQPLLYCNHVHCTVQYKCTVDCTLQPLLYSTHVQQTAHRILYCTVQLYTRQPPILMYSRQCQQAACNQCTAWQSLAWQSLARPA